MQWTVPNTLTLFRFALLPVFVWTFFDLPPMIALTVFILACLTDVLDGYIARRTKTVSDFGKWADPLADKLMTIAALGCLTIGDCLPWYFLVFYAAKEVLMIVGVIAKYTIGGTKKIYGAKPIGKLATAAIFVAIVLSFFKDQVAPWHITMMWISVGTGVASALYYYLYCYRDA